LNTEYCAALNFICPSYAIREYSENASCSRSCFMFAVPPGTGPPATGPPLTLPPGTGLFQYISYTFLSDRLLYVTDVARPFSSLDDATTVLITRCMMVWGLH